MHGPASVLCQRGNTVWIHNNREIRKVAKCRTKPYELVKRKKLENKGETDHGKKEEHPPHTGLFTL